MPRRKGIPAKVVFARIERDFKTATRAFRRHPYLSRQGGQESYTILDIFCQGYFAGLEARRRRRPKKSLR
jgi:hypothetical protein